MNRGKCESEILHFFFFYLAGSNIVCVGGCDIDRRRYWWDYLFRKFSVYRAEKLVVSNNYRG